MAPRPELIPKRALLLFPNVEQMMEWRKALLFPGINAIDFCLAFDYKQALTLLQHFQNEPSLKVVIGAAEQLSDKTAPGAEKFFKQLEAQSHTLLLEIADGASHSPVKDRVLKHLRKNNPKTITRRKNKVAAALTGEIF
jgi:hypothetical protein